MKTFYPIFKYIYVFVICTVLAISILLTHYPRGAVIIVYAGGLALVLIDLIAHSTITLSNSGRLTYHDVFWRSRSVELTSLRPCTYKSLWQGVTAQAYFLPSPHLHLYDATGGYVTIPTNIWLHSNVLYTAISEAVRVNNIAISEVTARKLHFKGPIAHDS